MPPTPPSCSVFEFEGWLPRQIKDRGVKFVAWSFCVICWLALKEFLFWYLAADLVNLRQKERREAVIALHKRACAVLKCTALEFRLSMTPEALLELRLTRAFAAREPLSLTLIGSAEQLDLWLSRKEFEFGDVTRADLEL